MVHSQRVSPRAYKDKSKRFFVNTNVCKKNRGIYAVSATKPFSVTSLGIAKYPKDQHDEAIELAPDGSCLCNQQYKYIRCRMETSADPTNPDCPPLHLMKYHTSENAWREVDTPVDAFRAFKCDCAVDITESRYPVLLTRQAFDSFDTTPMRSELLRLFKTPADLDRAISLLSRALTQSTDIVRCRGSRTAFGHFCDIIDHLIPLHQGLFPYPTSRNGGPVADGSSPEWLGYPLMTVSEDELRTDLLRQSMIYRRLYTLEVLSHRKIHSYLIHKDAADTAKKDPRIDIHLIDDTDEALPRDFSYQVMCKFGPQLLSMIVYHHPAAPPIEV